MKLLLLNILLFFSLLIFCQNQEANYKYNYTPIKSEGEIPSEYQKIASKKYNDDIISHEDNKESLSKTEKEFLLLSNYEINQTLFSGRALFGDKITLYLNKILDELLKNDLTLRKKISIYTFKSSTVNAACTSNGTIFINIGLFPRLESEAELAFIISHEISHFIKKHSLTKFVENEKILESKQSFDQKINKLFSRSKEKELEADSLGVQLFLKSKYNLLAVSKVLDKLYYSYLPYKESGFDKRFFNEKKFIIPASFFLDSTSTISSIGHFNDRYLTHPHVSKRKEHTSKIIENGSGNGNLDFIISKETFLEINELSKFENIRLSLLQKEYGNVIYYAHDLLKKYPENNYLQTSICKSLYGLAKYKTLNKYQEVAKSYHKTEGEIQQVHYLLRKLNTIQLNVLAIKYIQKTLTHNPKNLFIRKLMNNLIKDLVLTHKIRVREYFNNSFDSTITDNIRYFHKNSFIQKMSNENFITNFEQHYSTLDSINKWNVLSFEEQVKIQEEMKEKKNSSYGVKKALILDPFYEVYNKKNKKYFIAETKKNVFEKQITNISNALDLNIELINSTKLSSGSLLFYNDLCILKEWLNENWSHTNENIIPLLSDQIENIIQRYNTKYLYHTGIYESPPNSYYLMYLYDLQSGKIKIKNVQFSKNISKEKSYKFIKNDIESIIK